MHTSAALAPNAPRQPTYLVNWEEPRPGKMIDDGGEEE